MFDLRAATLATLLALLVACPPASDCPEPEPDDDDVAEDDDDSVLDDDDSAGADDDDSAGDDDDSAGDDDDSAGDDDDSAVDPPNQPPTAPAVVLTPEAPTIWDPVTCQIEFFSTDPDGDPIAYRFEWHRDGLPVPEATGTFVTVELTEAGEVWRCTVTPNDGQVDGPAGWAEETILDGGDPPTLPVLEIQPAAPTVDDDLSCVITQPSVDPDGGEISYTFEWFLDGGLFSTDDAEVDSADTQEGDEWMCQVEAWDLWSSSGPATATVVIAAAP